MVGGWEDGGVLVLVGVCEMSLQAARDMTEIKTLMGKTVASGYVV